SGLELPHEMFSLLARLLGTCDVLKDQQQVGSGMIRTFQSFGLEHQHQRISSRADFAMNLKMDDCGAVHQRLSQSSKQTGTLPTHVFELGQHPSFGDGCGRMKDFAESPVYLPDPEGVIQQEQGQWNGLDDLLGVSPLSTRDNLGPLTI